METIVNHTKIISDSLGDQLKERNYTLINGLRQVLKIITRCLIFKRVDQQVKFELENAFAITEDLIKKESEVFNPTTMRLKNTINNGLKENKHGDGVIVRIVKKKDFKIEKCSLINFYIYEN